MNEQTQYGYLLIPHLQIQNANALSSPLTIGFPAMTAWLGAIHALQRNLRQDGFNDVAFHRTAVVSHDFVLRTYREDGGFVKSIIGSRNPLKRDGNPQSFIEEPKCNLTVSLLVEATGLINADKTIKAIENRLMGMKMAGGDILGLKRKIEILHLNEDDLEGEERRVMRRLMPGYALIERKDLMCTSMQEGKDAMASMLECIQTTREAESLNDDSIIWSMPYKKYDGWLVPIAVGFRGISEVGKAKNQRDSKTLHRFAESVMTIGEFVMPYRLPSINSMLWRYEVDLNQSLYLCKNQ